MWKSGRMHAEMPGEKMCMGHSLSIMDNTVYKFARQGSCGDHVIVAISPHVNSMLNIRARWRVAPAHMSSQNGSAPIELCLIGL